MTNIAAPAVQKLSRWDPAESTEDYMARLHAVADTYDPALFPNICYFIGGDDTPVKIGMSTNVRKRLQIIQLHCPFDVRVLATAGGGQWRERAYHIQFRHAAIRGEWFERCPEIDAEITRLTNDGRS